MGRKRAWFRKVEMRLLLALIGGSIRSQMQHRASFLLWAVAQVVAVGVEWIALWALFARFGAIPGWSLPQVALLAGIVHMAFALAESAGRGFDQFSQVIRAGDFDRFLVRPAPTALLLAGQIFELSRLGRLLAGTAAVAWGGAHSGIVWTAPKLLFLLATITGGACLFYGVLILQATLCFWTVESLEVVNAITYGGITAAEMPLTIYPKPLRLLFTFIIPIACMNYVPAGVLLGRGAPAGPLAWLVPLVGPLFLMIALRIWRFGERRYTSTGS
jgi:ABC-2 type transport system permease protein